MRVVFVLCFILCSVWLRFASCQETQDLPKYDQRYEYLDVDAILDSKRLVKNYVECLLAQKPCTPEGKALRRVLPEALRTKCARCTERQKRVAVKVIHRLKSEYPAEWGRLAARWDPTGDFTRYFEEQLDKQTFNTIATSGNEPVPSVSQPPPAAVSVPPTASVSPDVVLVTPSTSPRPIVLNRFGDEDESQAGSTNNAQQPSSIRPVTVTKPKPTESTPMRFTYRPPPAGAPDMTPLYATTMTLIDHFGNKIIRTTELVADILRNTVRAVAGR